MKKQINIGLGKLLLICIIIIAIIVGIVFLIKNNNKNKKSVESEEESKTITIEDYENQSIYDIQSAIKSKEASLKTTNDEMTKLEENKNKLMEQLRGISPEKAQEVESEMGEKNTEEVSEEETKIEKNSDDIKIEENDLDEIKIEKIKEKLNLINLEIINKQKQIDEQTDELSILYEAYAKVSKEQ